jgi:VWFA-related protein
LKKYSMLPRGRARSSTPSGWEGARRLEKKSGEDAQFLLRRLAQQTGGRAFFPLEARELAHVYREIRDERSSQYALAYESSSPTKDGQWRRVAVQVKRPSVVVRTRQGYYAPAK